MSTEEGSDMPIERAEFDRMCDKVDGVEKELVKLKSETDNLKLKQGIQEEKISSIEKTLDKISTNVSRTFWAVITGVIMLGINYFFNPPEPELQTTNLIYFYVEGVEQIWHTLLKFLS